MRVSLRAARLRALMRWASEIPTPLATLHGRHGPIVHLRPTSSGVTLLGLNPERPQRGKGGFRDIARLVDEFEHLFAIRCVPEAHGRDTPEKELQSALIRDAYAHERRMEMLRAAAPGTRDPPLFVTDEIALPTDAGGEITCDLLCIREHSGGTYTPLVIELKSARQKARLVEQVESYAALVEEQLAAFEQFFAAILDREVRLAGPCERWIVWPRVGEGPDRHAADLAGRGIHLVTYAAAGGDFVLRDGITR